MDIWYHPHKAQSLELRLTGSMLHQRCVDLTQYLGELPATSVELPAGQESSFTRIREDQLLEAGWVRRTEIDFAQLFPSLEHFEPFQTWGEIRRLAEEPSIEALLSRLLIAALS